MGQSSYETEGTNFSIYSAFKGSLASFGGTPGIFVKLAGFSDNYAMYVPQAFPFNSNIAPVATAINGELTPTTAIALPWTDTANRLLNESNDISAVGSRSGDIVLFTDTDKGKILVNEADTLPGWHGGPTATESQVSMVWHYSDAAGADAAHRSDLLDIVKAATQKATGTDMVRNRNFKQILQDVINSTAAQN